MPKCQFVISKGKRKGAECGIYTTKQINEKYYCNSHYKMKDEPKQEPNTEPEEQEQEYEQLDEINFDNGHSLDDVIEATYKKKLIEAKNKSIEETILDKLNDINIRLNNIENKLCEPKNNIPEIEIFK